MEKSIRDFPKQFDFKPKIENQNNLSPCKRFLAVGMGGSAFPAEIIKFACPQTYIRVHKNYNLPNILKSDEKETLVIACSYSGNTEETISAYQEAKKRKLNLAAISVGGKLLELAKKDKVPFIKIPQTGIQPRMALGFILISYLKLFGDEKELKAISGLAKNLNSKTAEKKGKYLAEILWDKVPIIYASEKNSAVAYNWKIKFNESVKIPAFYNIFPELNHNEMTGLDVKKTTKTLSDKFHLIFLKDKTDHPKIIKRMAICEKLYRQMGLGVEVFNLEGKDKWIKIISSIMVVDWTTFNLASYYGNDPEQIPMVEEFKRLIR